MRVLLARGRRRAESALDREGIRAVIGVADYVIIHSSHVVLICIFLLC